MALCFFKHMSCLLLVIALTWLHCLVDANTEGNYLTGNATKSDLPESMPMDKDAASEGERSRNAGADVDQEHHREDNNSGTHEFGSDKDASSGRETGKNWQTGVGDEHHREDGRSGTQKLGGDKQHHNGCRQSQRHSKEKSRNLRGHDGSEGAASMEDEADKQACEEEGLGLWGILGIVGASLAVVCVCSTLARCFCCKGSSKSGIASITSSPVVVGIPMSNDVELKA